MATTSHDSYGTLISASTLALDTSLNALTTATGLVTSAAYDNSTGLYLFVDVLLTLGAQTARTAGALVEVYVLPSPDGTNYPDVELTCMGSLNKATFVLDTTTTARKLVACDLPIAPGLQKFVFRNASTQTLAATGNKVDLRPHNLKTV